MATLLFLLEYKWNDPWEFLFKLELFRVGKAFYKNLKTFSGGKQIIINILMGHVNLFSTDSKQQSFLTSNSI